MNELTSFDGLRRRLLQGPRPYFCCSDSSRGPCQGWYASKQGIKNQKVRVEVDLIILVRTKTQMSLASVQDLKRIGRILIIMSKSKSGGLLIQRTYFTNDERDLLHGLFSFLVPKSLVDQVWGSDDQNWQYSNSSLVSSYPCAVVWWDVQHTYSISVLLISSCPISAVCHARTERSASEGKQYPVSLSVAGPRLSLASVQFSNAP